MFIEWSKEDRVFIVTPPAFSGNRTHGTSYEEAAKTGQREMESDVAKTNRALELLAAAQSAAGDDSIYAQRIDFIDNYLNGLRNKSVQLAQKRGADPTVTDYLIAGQSAADLLRQRKFQDAMDAYVALASRIPIDAVAKTVRMENLLAQRKFDEVVEQFGDALKEAGRNDEALAAYREVLEEPAASSSDRQAAEAAVKAAGTSRELSNPTPNP